jgi:hypothetical protein
MIQVVPVNDIKPHTDDSTCECGVRVEVVNGEMIFIHSSFDGRELSEECENESE